LKSVPKGSGSHKLIKDLTEAVYFLVSSVSSYVTGEILDCGDGLMMD